MKPQDKPGKAGAALVGCLGPGPPTQKEAVQGAVPSWSMCVNEKHGGAQLFLGDGWVS